MLDSPRLRSCSLLVLITVLGGCPGDDASTPAEGSSSTTGGPSTSGPTADGPTNSATSSGDATTLVDGTSTDDPTSATTVEPTDTGTDDGSSSGGVEPPPAIDVVDCGDLMPGPIVGGEMNPLGFGSPCNPSSVNTSAVYHCCSDDPAAPGGALPDYPGFGIPGEPPLFADANNGLSSWGNCIDTAMIPAGSGLSAPRAPNCPLPCDPTWDDGQVDSVCGPSRVCCQTQQLRPEDCVLDGASGMYRPVTGADIGTLSMWAPDEHVTHQDPSGVSCLALAGGDPMNPIFTDCLVQLQVANHRGYCMALAPGQSCPHAMPGYVDACELINMGEIPPP